MTRHKRIYYVLMLGTILVLGLFRACDSILEKPEDQLFEYHAETYYVSADYLETGDETIEPLSVMGRKIELPQSEVDQIYEIVLGYLTEPMRDREETMVKEDMIRGVTVTDGIAVVDFNGELMHGGSMEEVYLIEQVVRTLVKSFEEIHGVRFTVDGESVDSLMGHLEANCTYGLITVKEDGMDVELVAIMEE